jgi:protein phosphatase PTC1
MGCLASKNGHSQGNEFFEVGLSHDINIAHRKTMEDAHVIQIPYMGDGSAGFFAVYDGHGGNEASEEAAKQFHEILEAEIRSKGSNPTPNMKQCFEATYEKMDEKLKTIATDRGTTAVTCMIRREGMMVKLYVANAGDARAVLSRNGRATRVSHDHKPSDEAEKKRITDSGGFITNDRVNAMLGVSRALGDHLLKKWVISTPYFVESNMSEGDSMLILACDGVWDVIEDQEAIDIVRGEHSIRLRLHSACTCTTQSRSPLKDLASCHSSTGLNPVPSPAGARLPPLAPPCSIGEMVRR